MPTPGGDKKISVESLDSRGSQNCSVRGLSVELPSAPSVRTKHRKMKFILIEFSEVAKKFLKASFINLGSKMNNFPLNITKYGQVLE